MSPRKKDFKNILKDEIQRSDLHDFSSIRTDSRGSYTLRDISLDKIKTKEQVRKNIPPDSILELVASIRSEGLIQPIEVVDSGDHYTIVQGHRRYAAFLKLNYATIPAIIRTGLPDDFTDRQMIENIQREDLNPIEEAAGYAHILERDKITQAELGDKIGKSQNYISNMISLAGLAKKYPAPDILSKLSKSILFELLPYSDENFLEIAIKKTIDDNLNQKEVRELLKNLKIGKTFDRESARSRKDFEEGSKEFINVIEEAGDKFMKCQLKYGKKMTPDRIEELKNMISPSLKKLFTIVSTFFPGSYNFDFKMDVGKPSIKFPGLDEFITIDNSLLDINYSFLDWDSSIAGIKKFIKERLPDLQDSVFKDFEAETLIDYWNSLAFSKNSYRKIDGYFFKAITGKYDLPSRYKSLKIKAIGKSTTKESGKFGKYNIPEN